MKKKLLWEKTVRAALAEDLGPGDITAALVPETTRVRGVIAAKQAGVLAGLGPAETAFTLVDAAVVFTAVAREGQSVVPGQPVVNLAGPARGILSAERTALNFLGRLSGIATLTRQFVSATAGTGAAVLDTRKTTPGLRVLEKAAVKAGGGINHRFGLYDGFLIKDNHISAVMPAGRPDDRAAAAAGLAARARAARESAGAPRPEIVVEAENEAEALRAASAGADVVLLDNLSPAEVARACRALRAAGFRGLIEVSGGVTLANIRVYAEAGADRISIGALTHSAPALDFSLEITGAEP